MVTFCNSFYDQDLSTYTYAIGYIPHMSLYVDSDYPVNDINWLHPESK